ncbi:hypothetical protein [uncultured Gemmiger sp.]|uniref:hypothetical protein n=1 Tax=uncultured Gemmiger sp. TaxID=1623490 RepID=UPI0025EB7D35|nr:hypothetical protein [uncultured Gemmiger sp.]
MSGKYDDIINLPHHVSPTRPPMSMQDRAAQFSPFAALTGYDAAIHETARLTDRKIDLGEDARAALDLKMDWLRSQLADQPTITIVYFVPDERKEGGAYRTCQGKLRQIDEAEQVLCLADGTRIPFEDVFDLRGEGIPDL